MTARARGYAAVLVSILLLALAGPALTPYPPGRSVGLPYAPSSPQFPLGTDHLGADVLSRVLSGGRPLIMTVLSVLLTAYLVGTLAGMGAAHRPRLLGTAILRIADVLVSLPAFVLLALAVIAFGTGQLSVTVAVTVLLLPDIVRVVRASTLQELGHDYVEAAVVRGETTWSVFGREIAPNLLPVLVADAGVRFVGAAFAVATAGFLGFGLRPPAPDWGLMILENRDGLALQPLAVVVPALLLSGLLLSANLLLDELRHDHRPARTRRRRPSGAPVQPSEAITQCRDLTVQAAGHTVLDGVSLTLAPGEILALVGKSGSGKTTLALALLGHFRAGLAPVNGAVLLAGHPVTGLPQRQLRRLRSTTTAYVGQDPRTALAPRLRIGAQIAEALRAGHVPRADRPDRIAAALRFAALPDDPAFQHRRPHELSGGQQQRAAIAIAIAHRPALLVLDEPTSALNQDVATDLLDDLLRLRATTGTAIVVISHNRAAVDRVADTVAVLDQGRLIEQGPSGRLLTAPHTERTRDLVAATAHPPSAARPTNTDVTPFTHAGALPNGDAGSPVEGDLSAGPTGAAVLWLQELTAGQPGQGRVIDGLDLTVAAGESVSVTGPSGCGKTTLLRTVAGLHPRMAGRVLLRREPLAASCQERSREQRRWIQVVPQNPDDSLNPRHTVARILGRPIALFATRTSIVELLERVGLDPALTSRRPAALSGGQRQRVAIARALAADPDLLLCDEITSALAPTAGAAVVDLLRDLRDHHGLAVLFVSHDLSLAHRLGGRRLLLADGVLSPLNYRTALHEPS